MSNDLMRIIELIKETFGESAKVVFQEIYRLSREVTDHELASTLNMRDSEIRKILYQLAEEGYVSARRVRDRETNYYVYYWRINTKDLPRIILNRKKMILQVLKKRIDHERRIRYVCPRCKREFTEEEALENEYICPSCAEPLQNIDLSERIYKLEELIKKLENEIIDEEKRILSRSS
jgi:transcription initiation factor TFIIE subunit alpha